MARTETHRQLEEARYKIEDLRADIEDLTKELDEARALLRKTRPLVDAYCKVFPASTLGEELGALLMRGSEGKGAPLDLRKIKVRGTLTAKREPEDK